MVRSLQIVVLLGALIFAAHAQKKFAATIPDPGHGYRYEGEGTSQFSFTEEGQDKNGAYLIEQNGHPRVGLRSDGTTGEIVDLSGQYSYTDDKGNHVHVTYTADATGYHPKVKITPA